MLRLILGRSGSGKTTRARNLAAELSKTTQDKIIFLVPEQYSFETERAFLELAGAEGSRRLEVLSFKRLADHVFRLHGGVAGHRLDDCGRTVLMGAALEQLKPLLKLWGRHAAMPEFIGEMLSMAKELGQSAITPDALRQAAAGDDSALSGKLTELALIIDTYKTLAARVYIDPLDDLTRLAEKLGETRFFRGKTVFIDAFKDFTGLELNIVKSMIRDARDVYITLCTDPLDKNPDQFDLLAPVNKTMKRLKLMASGQGVKIAAPVELPSGGRYKCEALKVLEAKLFHPDPDAPQDSPAIGAENIVIYQAPNAFDEADFVARTICTLVRDKGFRYREIAVLARNAADYDTVIGNALRKYKIPFFIDNVRPVVSMPLFVTVRRAVAAALNSFQIDDVLGLIKTGLLSLSDTEIAEFENYLFVWNITGSRLKEPFLSPPEGFTGKVTAQSERRLERINQTRLRVIKPLEELAAKLRYAGKAEQMAAAVYQFLIKIGADKELAALSERFGQKGETALAQEQRRTWDMLVNILDQTVFALGETATDAARYKDLLDTAIVNADFGSIPQGLDQIHVGSAGRTRPAAPRAVFILGAAAGIFPKDSQPAGLLTAKDRAVMRELGLEARDCGEEQALEERFLAYTAVTAASERLYVSCPKFDSGGDELFPSAIISGIKSVVKNCVEYDGNDPMINRLDSAQSPAPTKELLARLHRENDEISNSLKAVFNAELTQFTAEPSKTTKLSPETAGELFRGDINLSASKADVFYHCRFCYFCKYVLKVSPRRVAEIDVLERGSLVHYVLEQMVKRHDGKGLAELDDGELKTGTLHYLHEYLESNLAGTREKSPRFMYLFNRMSRVLVPVLRRIGDEFAQSEFTPAAFELGIGERGDVPAAKLPIPSGGHVSLDGKIDRVDIFERDGHKYIRIVDYKTGERKLNLGDAIQGLNMQMLIYLFTLVKNGGSKFGGLPAGALYFTANRKLESIDREDGKTTPELPAANGVILNDEGVIRAMERTPQKKFIPVEGEVAPEKLKLKSGSLADLEMFEKISNRVDGLLCGMAQTLRSGDFAADPMDGSASKACEYCDFGELCGKAGQSQARKTLSTEAELQELLKT